jgi:acetyl esterase/lipase
MGRMSHRAVSITTVVKSALYMLWAATALPLMGQQTPFLDPMFSIVDLNTSTNQLAGSSPNNNIIYGTGPVSLPTPGVANLQLDLYHPTGPNLPAKMPGAVFIHGGGFNIGAKEDGGIRNLAIEYAKRGYISVSIGYRLNGSFLPGSNANPSAAIQDATKAVQWMIAQAVPGGRTEKLMTDKIVIGGGSAGAITAIMQGCSNNASAQPKVIVNCWGMFVEGLGIAVDADDPPVFTIHGTSDTTVPFTNATILSGKLGAPGIQIPHKLFALAKQPHSVWNTLLLTKVDGRTVVQHSVDFCYEHLGFGIAPSSVFDTLPPNELRIASDASELVTYWKGLPGKVYDLLSDTQLSGPSSSWPVYQSPLGSGTATYSDIPSGGNSVVVMTRAAPVPDAARFFVVRERLP